MNYSYFFDYETEEKICLIYTLKCNASCQHCITKSNMSRNDKIAFESAKEIIQAASKNNKKAVIFSGGEVLIFFDEILELTRFASSCGMDVMIETNGFWAESPSAAKGKMELLKQNGLKTIFVSYDYFHSKFISCENIKYIADTSQDIGLKCEVMFTRSNNPDEDRAILEDLSEKSFSFYEDDLLPFGRACDMFGDSDKKALAELNGCDSFATTFLPNGDAFACCNINDENAELKMTPMYLGNINHDGIQEIFQKEKENKFLCIISDKASIDAFMDFLAQKGLHAEKPEKEYFSVCDLCISISSDAGCMNVINEFLQINLKGE